MRITVFAIGSRGDVQPSLALALGLRGAGYDITIAPHANFEDFVRSHGLAFAPMEGDPNGYQQTPACPASTASGPRSFRPTWTGAATRTRPASDS